MNEQAGLRETLHERIEGMRIHSQRQGTWGIEYGDDRFMADVLRVIDEALAASSEGPGLDVERNVHDTHDCEAEDL